MSRRFRIPRRTPMRFPRVSGDEPVYAVGTPGVAKFSPRERG